MICPGSFNPVTRGHVNVFERCSRLFDEVVVVVMHNAAKTYHVSAQQRVDWIEQSVAHLPNVRVDACGGLLAEYAVQCGAKFIVKGVRDAADMVVETQMYYANREASQGQVDTLLLPTQDIEKILQANPDNIVVVDETYIEFAPYGGDISAFVPPVILEQVAKAYRKG